MTDTTTPPSEPSQPLGLGCNEQLGAGSEARTCWPGQGPIEKPLDPRAGCSECRFAGPRHGYDSYPCRRRAPLAVHDPNKHCGVHEDAFVPRWPLMSGRDWCGEFERA